MTVSSEANDIMTDDSDINATRHARSVVGGVVAGATGLTDIFVSGGLSIKARMGETR